MKARKILIKELKENLSHSTDMTCEINGNAVAKFFNDGTELPIGRAVFDIDSDTIWLDNITDDGMNTIDIDSCSDEVVRMIWAIVKA